MSRGLLIAGAVAALIALPVGCSLYSSWSSVATAPSRVVNKTLQTDNIINNYEWFYDQSAAYQRRVDQVRQYREQLSTETDADEKRRLRVELNAVQATCRQLATEYNANAAKVNRSVFKTRSTPAELSMEDCDA